MTPSSPDPSSPEETPFEIEPFDPEIHVSPHALFRRLKDALEGVGRGPDGEGGQGGEGPEERNVILVDADGLEATRRARELREAGHQRVFALYGGLELYDYALDPLVVGEERFLI